MFDVMVTKEDTRYLVTIYTDRNAGQGKLYHFPDRTTAHTAGVMSPETLQGHEIGGWTTNISRHLGEVLVSLQASDGFIVASETGPGPEVRWSRPYAIVQVVS